MIYKNSKANDIVVVFRKTTSMVHFYHDPDSYDTILSGGDLQFLQLKVLTQKK